MNRFTSFFQRVHDTFVPTKNKLPFITLAFTFSALILTVIVVQEQQTLSQEAAKREICPTGPEDDTTTGSDRRSVTSVITQKTEVNITQTKEKTAPTIVIKGNPQGLRNAKPLTATERERRKNGIKGQLLVKYKKGKSKKTAEDKVKRRKGKLKKRNDRINVDVMEVPQTEEANTINELRNDPNVEYIERDGPAFTILIPNDKAFKNQHALENTGQTLDGLNVVVKKGIDIDAPLAWDRTLGKGIIVAVIDSGIDESHPDLKGKIAGTKNLSTSSTTDDIFGHGTAVAGVIAATTNNGEGIAGVCPDCKLLNVKVSNDSDGGVASLEPIAEAIHWSVDNGAKVINISIASQIQSRILEDAVNYAWGKGVLVVAGAGNCGGETYAKNSCSNQNPIMYPAAHDNAVAVGAIDYNGNKALFSEHGSWVDVMAPGVEIATTAPTKKYNSGSNLNYAYFSGTSFSAPMVAGIAALAYSTSPSVVEVRKKIEGTAIKGSGSFSAYGLVNASRAVSGSTTEPLDPETESGSESAKPSKDKIKKSPKPCRPIKKGTAGTKPTKVLDEDGNRTTGRYSPRAFACRVAGGFDFCKGGKKTKTKDQKQTERRNKQAQNDCLTNPPRDTRQKKTTAPNAPGGSNKNGKVNNNSNQGTVKTGNIDPETTITIRNDGRTVQIDSTEQLGDIGPNTTITIKKDGGTKKVDNSGGSGNQQISGKMPPTNTADDCAGKKQKNDKKARKPDAKTAKNNAKNKNKGKSPLHCRVAPFLKTCKSDAQRKADDKKKKERDDEKKKRDKQKNDKKKNDKKK
jgi:thermitase